MSSDAEPSNPVHPSLPPARSIHLRRQVHALLNKAQVQELAKAKRICAAALHLKYRAALEARGISVAFVQGLLDQMGLCGQKSSEAMQQTLLKENYKAAEVAAKKALLRSLAEIQSAAKQKYARSNPAVLQEYCVGKDLDASRAALEHYSRNILARLAGAPTQAASSCSNPIDTLPGITPEKVAALGALRWRWKEAQASQAQSQTLATSLRAERDTLVQIVTDQRIQIQFAAEAEWPAGDTGSATKRRAFLLQPTRPFSLAA
jgi:hypothetical protein